MIVRPDRFAPPDTGDVEDVAAYWLARQEVSPDAADDPRFLEWLAASPDHQAGWARAQRLWALASQAELDDPLTNALRASALARRPDPWPVALLAACLVALVAGGTIVWRQQSSSAITTASADPQSRLGAPDFLSSPGGRVSTTLSDGTRLELDTNSAVDLAFDKQHRQLRLVRGQAFVDVAADKRPFSIEAGDQTIIDQGTAFATRLDGQTVSVVLVSGKVAVGPQGQAPRHALAPGQRLTVSPARAAKVETVDVGSALAWRDGFVEFSNTRLDAAAAELNRYGGQPLLVRDPRVAALRTSGRFKVGDAERFVRSASTVLPIVAVRTAAGVEIRMAAR